MRRHRALSIGLVIALLLTGLLPAAGLTAPPAIPTQAVSYTHLDVYKRQILVRSSCQKLI